MSNASIDRLGGRLAATAIPSQSDLTDLEHVRGAYDEPARRIARLLSELGQRPTMRPMKTTNTIVDKLRREPTMRLSQMQDIAGGRIVGPYDLVEQRRAANLIEEALGQEGHRALLFDRRATPSFGYRAIHVVAILERYRVEIQVRTELQHLWAELAEKLGDLWGRGLRYGTDDYGPLLGAGTLTRREVVSQIQDLSDIISEVENLRVPLSARESDLELHPPADDADSDVMANHYLLAEELESDKEEYGLLEDRLRGILNGMMQVLVGV